MNPFSEQFLLLSVDPVTGRAFPVSEQVINLTLAGALLFDASFSDKINDDWQHLTVLDTSETGNMALDEAIRCLLITDGPIPLHQALSLVAAHGKTLRRMVWDSMVSKGLVSKKKSKSISSAGNEDLYTPNITEVVAVHKQIRKAVLESELPEIQLPPLISLMNAGKLTRFILKPEEISGLKQKIDWLSNIESLGREIISSVKALESADLEQNAAHIIGLKHGQPKTYAGGMDAVLTSLSFLYKETGLARSRKTISHFNQVGGFECPGCAWPNPDKNRSRFEFCENGAKNVSAEACNRTINRDFFGKWPVSDLLLTSGYWLEQQGRLTEPMFIGENDTHYQPIAWEEAFSIIAKELNSLEDPNQAVFYASGRTSNEAGYLYQLFARAFGTNNLPNSANLCHEPSGKAMTISLGFGKSSVALNDFPKSDLIFLFGHNPGSNHPRMLSALQSAVRKGSKIVAVNPMPEASLMGFADPQEAASYLGKQTRLAHLYLQPRINGDMALIRGLAKILIESDKPEAPTLDHTFINAYTSGFSEYTEKVRNTSWDVIVNDSGIDKSQISELASLYQKSKNTIACWCLGITHHKNSIETIREIVNLMLLKGNIGRPGTGLCPVRGHSNIQGLRTSGVGENMPLAFLEALEEKFSIQVPRKPGMSVVPAIQSMAEGRTKVLISLGGNLASACPDTPYTEKALRSCNLTVQVSTKLNRSHLVHGKKALILPALTRSDEDSQNGKKQYVTIEDAMGKLGFSKGMLAPASPEMRSEISIIAGMARATLGKTTGIDWEGFALDYQTIRKAMSGTIPALSEIGKATPEKEGYYLYNPLKKRIFPTPEAKALFSAYPLQRVNPEPEELLMMTIRSHDQFNTSVFGLNDRYRGISNERRVLFMNRTDMEKRKIFIPRTTG